MSEKSIKHTTNLKDLNEGFSGLSTANTQNINNTNEKGFSGVVNANNQNATNDKDKSNMQK